jgi:hypothetical protein
MKSGCISSSRRRDRAFLHETVLLRQAHTQPAFGLLVSSDPARTLAFSAISKTYKDSHEPLQRRFPDTSVFSGAVFVPTRVQVKRRPNFWVLRSSIFPNLRDSWSPRLSLGSRAQI